MKIIKESIYNRSNKLILDESLFKPLMEDLSYYQDRVDGLLSSTLVDTVEATDFNGNEAFKLTANDGKVLYLVPSTLSQVDVYDNQGNVLDTNVFWRYIIDEFIQTEEAGFVYEIVGGDCAGTYTIDELKNLPCFDGKYSDDQSEIRNNGGFTHRKELDNQPELNGYLGPIFNGWDENHNAILRYETQEVYDALSESKVTEAFTQNIDLDRVVIDVANLLDEEELGDNWIEVFPTVDSYPIGNGEYGIKLEITGADESARKANFHTSNGRVKVSFWNSSEGVFNSAEEIARFIAGEYGLTLNESKSVKESLDNDSFKTEVIDWLSDHGQAWEDATDFFGSNDLLNIDLDDIVAWISEHDILCDDFIRRFDADSLEESFDDDACLEKTGYHIYELKDKAVEVSGADIKDGSFGVKNIICSGNTCKVIGYLVDDDNDYAEYDIEFEIDKKINTDESLITGALLGGAAAAIGNSILGEDTTSNSINLGDTVRVKVANNRIGTVTKLIGDDLIEVEFEAEGKYPARNDRYYISDVELLDNDLTICPNCGGTRFNDNTGFCIDCGYDEKSYGDLDESNSIKEGSDDNLKGYNIIKKGNIFRVTDDNDVELDIDFESEDSAKEYINTIDEKDIVEQ